MSRHMFTPVLPLRRYFKSPYSNHSHPVIEAVVFGRRWPAAINIQTCHGLRHLGAQGLSTCLERLKSCMLYFDEPITSSTQDELFRSDMARRCAKTISEIRSDSAFVIGLSGEWGAGKTSFINMVKEALADGRQKAIVVNLNAWLYSSQEQLVRQFFGELTRSIEKDEIRGVSKEAVKELGLALREYSDALSDIGFTALSSISPLLKVAPSSNVFGKLLLKHAIGKAGTYLNNEKTIEQMRTEITKRLSKLDENVLIVIDDVDRLPKEEICALFKLVNLTASFPRMTYLLSYDSGVVCRVLTDVQGIDGMEYLEKIVQLPIDLPQPHSEVLKRQVESAVAPYIESQRIYSAGGIERVRLLQVLDPLVTERIQTPRNVKRFLNAFQVMCMNVGEEICPTDTIAMTGISLFCPNVANWIWKNRHQICSGFFSGISLSDCNSARLLQTLREAAARDVDEVEPLVDALAVIFPKIGSWDSSAYGSPPIVSRETGRVAHIANLELVFSTSACSDVKRAELYELALDCDSDRLTDGILRLEDKGELTRLVEIIDSCRPTLESKRKSLISGCLLRVFGRLKQEDGSPLRGSQIENASHLLSALLGDIGISSADDLMKTAVKEYGLKDYLGLSWFLQEEMAAQSGNVAQQRLSADCFAELSNAYIDTVVESYPNILYLPKHPAKFLWRHLDEFLGGSALQIVRERYSEDATVAVLCTAEGLSTWSSGLSEGYAFGPSVQEGYELVFENTSVEDIDEFVRTARFSLLPDEMRLRVASLFLLLRDRELEHPIGGVTYEMALEVLNGWEASSDESS